jgi:hypothetical protein
MCVWYYNIIVELLLLLYWLFMYLLLLLLCIVIILFYWLLYYCCTFVVDVVTLLLVICCFTILLLLLLLLCCLFICGCSLFVVYTQFVVVYVHHVYYCCYGCGYVTFTLDAFVVRVVRFVRVRLVLHLRLPILLFWLFCHGWFPFTTVGYHGLFLLDLLLPLYGCGCYFTFGSFVGCWFGCSLFVDLLRYWFITVRYPLHLLFTFCWLHPLDLRSHVSLLRLRCSRLLVLICWLFTLPLIYVFATFVRSALFPVVGFTPTLLRLPHVCYSLILRVTFSWSLYLLYLIWYSIIVWLFIQYDILFDDIVLW